MIKRVWAVIVFVALLLGAENVRAQDKSLQEQLDAKIAFLLSELDAAPNDQTRSNKFKRNSQPDLFALAIAVRKQASMFVVAAEDARVDKQVGGSDSNAGSTSLVSKGSIPSILGYAVENGALTRDVSGTTITFRGNPVGIAKALSNAGFIDSYQNSDGGTQFLRRLSFALSFDTSRGSGMGEFTGDRQQLSSYSIRCDIVNHRDPRDADYNADWSKLISHDGVLFSKALARIDALLEDDPTFNSWHEAASKAVMAASKENRAQAIRAELAKLGALSLATNIDAAAESFLKAYSAFLQSRGQLLEAIAKGPIITFEYTNIRRVDAVDLSNFKLIAEGAFFHGRADLTANASLTILNKIPTGTNLERVQDVDLSGQLDVPLGEVQKIGSIVLSFSGKYKHLMQDTMMASGMMADTKGDIGVGQVKLTIPIKGSGVKIPISFTFANRTELVKEKFVRGNIGITFDLDSIFAKFKP